MIARAAATIISQTNSAKKVPHGGVAKLRYIFSYLAFWFIGAEPNTDWLYGSDVAFDQKGFVLTGADASENRHPLETSRPGVFAIGDVRSGSVKRVASAVGEGAQVVATLHRVLAAARGTAGGAVRAGLLR